MSHEAPSSVAKTSKLVLLPELLFEVLALQEKMLMGDLFPRFLGRVPEAHAIPQADLFILLNGMRALGAFLLMARFPRYFPATRHTERVVGWELRRAFLRFTAQREGADERAASALLERVGALLQIMDESDDDVRIASKMSYCYLEELGLSVPEASSHAIAAIQFSELLLESSDILFDEVNTYYRLS